MSAAKQQSDSSPAHNVVKLNLLILYCFLPVDPFLPVHPRAPKIYQAHLISLHRLLRDFLIRLSLETYESRFHNVHFVLHTVYLWVQKRDGVRPVRRASRDECEMQRLTCQSAMFN
ncbi:uncharacterized protein BO80DRAFT_392164 [Aspergillus ibericus CBS 121593]|uniref:Uncharacterized protein n=1 Tax=Aspergillus ibericus CBS 121593 TaxID=1448316 RepID=A0A395GLP4_9EURO|nr:hypothetical protein BO80DRAFT_392164 [Aspergillus ibericus CBS 121593]RAK96236.1 hypothetical protein BO80DRAFT_392164 [Aspergillus ibericus CBS 121593]